METELVEDLQIQEPPELPDEMPSGEEEAQPSAETAAPPHEEEDPDVLDELREMGLDPGKKGRVSKRVKQLLSRAKAAEEKAVESDSWKQEALRLAQEREAKAVPAKPAEIQLDGLPPKPKWEDFEDSEQFTEALTEWKVEEKLAKREAQERQAKAAKQGQEWMQRGLEKHPDFLEKTVNNNGIRITGEMTTALLAHEDGPEIAYYLGNNPAETFRIAGLHPVEQAVEIRKLATKVKTQTSKTTTEAPAPTKPVTGGRETVSSDDIEEKIRKGTVKYHEYEAYMNAKEQGGSR